MNTITESTTTQRIELVKPGQFGGMLKQWQGKAFVDLTHAGVNNHVAHKICVDYGSDLGRMLSTDGKFKSKIGKLNADGERNIAIAGKSVIKTSNSMSVVYVAQTMDTLFTENLLASRRLPTLSQDLEEYLQGCEDWAAEQNWSDAQEK